MLKIGSLTVNGTATAGKDGRVSGWIRVPCESVPEIDNMWNPSNEGDYPLPSVWVRTEGTVKKAVMPHCVHVRSRWPLPDIYTPAADYRENPGAYLVYFEWIPEETEVTAEGDFVTETEMPSVTELAAETDKLKETESKNIGVILAIGIALAVTVATAVGLVFRRKKR